MTADDAYAGFAARYDLFPPDAAAEGFFRDLVARHRLARVLDCACGTGRELILFHRLGCDVTGADLSPAMLARARENLAREGIDALLVELDYRNLPAHVDAPFDAVLCLSGALLECEDEAEMGRALASMRAVLRPGGLLILAQGMTDKMWRERPRFLLELDTPEITRLFVIDYLDRGARFNILDIRHGRDEPGLEVWSMAHPRVLLGTDYARLLGAAGFATVTLYGSYGFDPYDPETSDRLIVVAEA